jgi:hypothetical protein
MRGLDDIGAGATPDPPSDGAIVYGEQLRYGPLPVSHGWARNARLPPDGGRR